jgi:NAD(P)-dependent dehydrogenase (short-subunit alcohol dehydrogenase family)
MMVDLKSQNLDQLIEEDGSKIVRDHFRHGDVAVITGCARGFGRAIARRLARDGAKLAVWDVIEDEGEETAKICRALGADAQFVHCDLGNDADIAKAATTTFDRFGPVYALVNNAGINLRTAAIDYSAEQFRKTLNVNLIGSFLTAQAFARRMIERQRGVIINLASGRAIEGAVNSIGYGASKAAIVNMTKTLATEWAKYGIRVNAIVPGVSETRQPLEAGGTLEALVARTDGIPLGRIGHPDDIAGMVAMLLSKDAAYITGQAMAINGGRIMLP